MPWGFVDDCLLCLIVPVSRLTDAIPAVPDDVGVEMARATEIVA